MEDAGVVGGVQFLSCTTGMLGTTHALTWCAGISGYCLRRRRYPVVRAGDD
ncbi:hypothetical protein ACNKHM_11720 [Shigella sonnei]